MREEKTKYTSSILTSKSPFDVTEISRVRLSQAKLINKEVHLLLKDVSELKQKYVQQLRRIVAVHEDLDKVLYNEIVQSEVLTEDEMSRIDFDWLGNNVRDLWAHIISGLKTELHLKHSEYKILEKDVLPPLLEFNTAEVNWKEVKSLHQNLAKIASKLESKDTATSAKSDLQLEWSEKAPYLLEGIETLDENRLVLLKRCLLQYQNLMSDSLHSCLDENEKILAALLEFSPTDEVEKFASTAADYSFKFTPATSNGDQKLTGKVLTQPASTGGLRSRKSSSASAIKNILGDSFSDSSNNPSLQGTRTSKLRSKVGSLFGRRKLKKSPQVHETVIAESEGSSLSGERAKSTPISEDTSKLSSKGSDLPATKSAATSSAPATDDVPPLVERQPAKVATGLSIHQPPLKPRLRNNYSSEHMVTTDNSAEQNTNVAIPEIPIVLGQPVTQSISVGGYEGSRDSHNLSSPSQGSNESNLYQPQISLPPPRKTHMQTSQNMKKYNDSFHTEDGDSIFESRQRSRRSYSSPQEIFPTTRQDAQSSHFNNISKPEQERSAVRLSSFASTGTGDLRTLNPQVTGTNLSLSLSYGQGQSIFQHTELTSTGLNSSIGQVINAKFKDGILVSSQLIGEIALNYFSADYLGDSVPLDINLKIISELPFERLIINNMLLEKSEVQDELVYRVDPQQIFHKTIGAVKYSLQTSMVPIVIHPVWKFEETQASVMLTIKCLPALAREIEQLVLEDLIVSVSIEDAIVKSALSKPQGSFSKEKKRITWRFKEQVILRSDSEERLIARFLTEGMAKESSKGVQARFTIRDTQVPGKMKLLYQEISLDDPFGAGTAGIWNEVSTSRTLVAGSYYGLSA